jgi:formate dehydrogenase iron-sulfur subunit
MANIPGLEILQSSAELRGSTSGGRTMPRVAKLIDTTTCIGCKACEVACQEWNDLPAVPTTQVGSYQTMPSLHASYWNLIKFNEVEVDGDFSWLMRKDQCMHCDDPGCLKACPAPGAIVQYANGIVDVNQGLCIGCRLCENGCPFDVPRYHAQTGKMAKCTLCVDRTGVSLEPACVKACPTGCLHFGTKEDMVLLGMARVEQLKSNGNLKAGLYDPQGVGGTGVITVLKHADQPELYGLPKDPTVPVTVRAVKGLLKPLGLVAMAAVVLGFVRHYLRFGPREPPPVEPPPPPPPAA